MDFLAVIQEEKTDVDVLVTVEESLADVVIDDVDIEVVAVSATNLDEGFFTIPLPEDAESLEAVDKNKCSIFSVSAVGNDGESLTGDHGFKGRFG